MTRDSRKLEQLEKLYRAQHDIDVLNELRRMRQKAGLFATFKGQVIHQDQLEALENIARQYRQDVESIVAGFVVDQGLLVHLGLTSTRRNAIELSVPPNLTHCRQFFCQYNGLTALKIPFDFRPETLVCSHNELTELQIPPGAHLQSLDCTSNNIVTLQIPPGTPLTTLRCYSNDLQHLDLDGLPLDFLACSNNRISILTIPRGMPIERLSCENNGLTQLTIPAGIPLGELRCNGNLLEQLHIPEGTPLAALYCDNNRLSALTIPSGTPITLLNCSFNNLTNLIIPPKTPIRHVWCRSNPLTSITIPHGTFDTLDGVPPDCQINYH